MRIRQYLPGYVTGIKPATIEFATLDELLKIPFVQSWKKGNPKFHRYSLHDDMLMVEENAGKTWWVLGFIEGAAPGDLDLPEWTGGPRD